jgi:hypothetical protein
LDGVMKQPRPIARAACGHFSSRNRQACVAHGQQICFSAQHG